MQLRVGYYGRRKHSRIKNSFPFIKSQAVTGSKQKGDMYIYLFASHGNCFRMQAHKKLVSGVTQESVCGPIL